LAIYLYKSTNTYLERTSKLFLQIFRRRKYYLETYFKIHLLALVSKSF